MLQKPKRQILRTKEKNQCFLCHQEIKRPANFITKEPKKEEASTSKAWKQTALKWRPKRIQSKASPVASGKEQTPQRAQPQMFKPASVYDPIKTRKMWIKKDVLKVQGYYEGALKLWLPKPSSPRKEEHLIRRDSTIAEIYKPTKQVWVKKSLQPLEVEETPRPKSVW